MDLLAHKSVSTDVIDNVRYIFASQREFKPRNPDADIPKDLFISCNPEFRKAWSRLDKKAHIAILHCKADKHGDIKRACVVEIMKWADANDLEHKQLLEYKVFIDKGQFIESNILNGYQQIRTFDANLMHDVLSGKAVTGILHFCAQLHKRHNVLSFHYVQSLMACSLINLQHIKLEANVSNILSKHWGYQACWELN
jgi:hypothetical protein